MSAFDKEAVSSLVDANSILILFCLTYDRVLKVECLADIKLRLQIKDRLCILHCRLYSVTYYSIILI